MSAFDVLREGRDFETLVWGLCEGFKQGGLRGGALAERFEFRIAWHLGQRCEEMFSMTELRLADDLWKDPSDCEIEAAAVVIRDPLGQVKQVWGEGRSLVEESEDGSDAANVGVLHDGENGSRDGAVAEGNADAVSWAQIVAPSVWDSVVEQIASGIIELDFCEKTAWPFEFERDVLRVATGFLAGHVGGRLVA